MELQRSTQVSPTPSGWPFASPKMSAQIRAFNWASTPLGPLDRWPSTLRCAVDTMLGCAFPSTLQWGPDLLLFYNDPYIPLIESHHPHALGRPILKTFPEIAATYQTFADRVLRGEAIALTDQPYRYSRNGQTEDRWFDLSYSPIHDEHGSVAGILAVGVDTTARVLAELAREKTDERFRRVLETDAVGVIFFDHTGTVVDANDVFLRMVGYTREDIAARALTWRTMTPPEWVAVSEEQMVNLSNTGRIGPYEKEYVSRDGTRRWMLFAGRDLGDGTIAEYAIDISVQKRAERQSHEVESLFRAFVEASSDTIYRMSPDWREMRQLKGRDFLVNTDAPDSGWIQKYIHPDDQAAVRGRIREAVQTQSTFQLEHRVLRANGSIGWTSLRAIPVRNEHGEITEWFGAASDISTRKHAEEAMVRTERLTTLGRLSASIAHEINNPLAAATNLLYLARHTETVPPEAAEFITLAEAELTRVSNIAHQSLGFYRESSIPQRTSLSEILSASIDLLSAKIAARRAQILRQWPPDLKICAVSGELRQVFSNLLANSLDAIDPEGCIVIRASRRTARNGPVVRVTFSDSGRGIEPEKQSHIFDPFYSTKGNLGTGLGLWVTRQIVDKHQGTIRMRSRTQQPHAGTTFSVTLPA